MQNWKHFQTVLQPGDILLTFSFFNKETEKPPEDAWSMWQRATKGRDTLCYNTILAILPKEITPCIRSILSGEHHGQLHTAVVWGSTVTSLTLTQVEKSLSVWQLSQMKKHFWSLWARLVYLLCLWVALSSVFSPNWILCTHSHRRICISSYTRCIYLSHTHLPLCVYCFLCIMTARALPSHLFAFSLNPPSVWCLSLNIKRSIGRKRCSSI